MRASREVGTGGGGFRRSGCRRRPRPPILKASAGAPAGEPKKTPWTTAHCGDWKGSKVGNRGPRGLFFLSSVFRRPNSPSLESSGVPSSVSETPGGEDSLSSLPNRAVQPDPRQKVPRRFRESAPVDGAEHLLVGAVSPRLLLGVDEPTVHGHLEDPATGRNHLHVDVLVPFSQCGRQTGGSGLVVSNGAVFDAHPHAASRSMVRDDSRGVGPARRRLQCARSLSALQACRGGDVPPRGAPGP